MKRFLFLALLCFLVMPASAETINKKTDQGLAAQDAQAEDAAKQFHAMLDQNIDTSAEWGRWFTTTFKPYMNGVEQMQKKYLEPIYQSGGAGVPEDEIRKKTKVAFSDLFKALQAMTPPPELNSYHSKLLEVVAEASKNENEELMTRLAAEMEKELGQVFERHGVPQKVINMFTGNP